MYPSLSREQKFLDAWNKRNRDSLLRGLRETVAAVRADKARGR
jgi:hypothetical protein